MKGFRGVRVGSRAVLDDRRRAVRLRWAGHLRPGRFLSGDFDRGWRRAAQEDIRLLGMGSWLWVVLVAVCAVVGLVSWAGWWSPPGWVMTVLIVVTMGVFVYYQSETAPLLARRLWVMGRCMGCGYALGQIPEREDGCTVCPECGGAWAFGRPQACGGCGYSFAGLGVDGLMRVRCPECGKRQRVEA